MTFSFYINSLLYGKIPAEQGMMGKMVPKMNPNPYLHYFCSINSWDFSRDHRGDEDLDMLVSVFPYTTFTQEEALCRISYTARSLQKTAAGQRI